MLTYPFVTLSKPVSPVRLVSREELLRSNPLRRHGKVPSPKEASASKRERARVFARKGKILSSSLVVPLGLEPRTP